MELLKNQNSCLHMSAFDMHLLKFFYGIYLFKMMTEVI